FYQDLVNLAHLKSLNLGLNRFLKAQDLMLVAINCRGLEELRLSRRRTNSEQHTLTDPDASFLFHNMRYSLTSLKFDAQGLGAETFQAILSCSLLENLCLTNALFLTGDLFQSIPKKLPNLTKLKITKACQLTTHDFSHMFMFEREKMKKLTSLNISGCWRLDDFGLKAIVDTTFKSLEQLSLHSCKSLTSDGIDYVIKGSHDAALWMELVFTKQYVDTEEVQRLLRKSPRLRVLRLHRKDRCVNNPQSNNKLEVLEVKRCSGRLAESLMNRLIFNCPLLRILAFKDSQFHSRSFFVLLHRLPLLTSINLGYNHYFELEDLVCIANVCDRVTEIKILSSRMFFNRELSECNKIFTKVPASPQF
ncbi:unnamed protein product, partial [Timema podura]|nr:unnamed protein product [Timema podura]